MNSLTMESGMEDVILTIFAIIVLIIFVWCLVTFVRAIFFFIFSQAKEENKKKWWNSIRFMIIGLVLTFLLLFLVPTILRLMNVPDYKNYSIVKVFRKSSELMWKVFDLWNIIKESQELNQYRGQFYYDTDSSSTQPSWLWSSSDFEL